MNIATLVARIVLGLIFTLAGLNGFLHFLPLPPKPAVATQFIGLLDATHYMVPVFALQLIGGLLFLVNRFVPLALTLIAPVLVNILLFHLLMDLHGTLPGAIATLCWAVVFHRHRQAFAPLFQVKSAPDQAAVQTLGSHA